MKPLSDFTTPRRLIASISRHFLPVEQPEPFCCTTGLKNGSRFPLIAHFLSSGLGLAAEVFAGALPTRLRRSLASRGYRLGCSLAAVFCPASRVRLDDCSLGLAQACIGTALATTAVGAGAGLHCFATTVAHLAPRSASPSGATSLRNRRSGAASLARRAAFARWRRILRMQGQNHLPSALGVTS